MLGEGTGVKLDDRGRVAVDEHCWTGVEGIWAVGDCVRGPMLAHKGFEEGIAVAEIISGKAGHVNYDTIPWVIYTEPEIAWVGKTEEAVKDEGIPYKTGSFPFAAVGRAVAMNETGGPGQGDRARGNRSHPRRASWSARTFPSSIAEAVVAMEFQGSSRGSRAHRACASDVERSGARGGDVGGQAGDTQDELMRATDSLSRCVPTRKLDSGLRRNDAHGARVVLESSSSRRRPGPSSPSR